MDALQSIAVAAVYPGAPGQSVIGLAKVDVAQGWPLANDVDKAMAGGRTLVSVFPIASSTASVETPFDWSPGVVSSPAPGISAAVIDASFTISGVPNPGDYATVLIGSQAYSYAAGPGDTSSSVAAAIFAQIQADHPDAVYSLGAVAIPSAVSLTVRCAAPATVGRIVHRQRQNFQISVFSPTPAERSAVAIAIDVALKRSIVIQMRDTSDAICISSGVNLDDKFENEGVYRRSLIYSVQWDTVDTYPAWPVTSVSVETLVGNQPSSGT